MGAGYVQYQELVRINDAIENGSFFENPALRAACAAVRDSGTLHLMGLLSTGGVHADMQHLAALVELARREGVENVVVHAFLDGRDMAAAERARAHPPGDRAASRRCTGATTRWTATSAGTAIERSYRAIVDADAPARRDGRGCRCASATPSRSAATSSSSPASSAPARRCATATRSIFFNFRPDRARRADPRPHAARLRRVRAPRVVRRTSRS